MIDVKIIRGISPLFERYHFDYLMRGYTLFSL